MRFTAGVHPHDAASWDEATAASIRALVEDPNCGAVGECGLDYDRMKAPREVQVKAFAAQAAMSVEAEKSLFLHCRELDADRGETRATRRVYAQACTRVATPPHDARTRLPSLSFSHIRGCVPPPALAGPPLGAHADLLRVLSEAKAPPSRCCVHCFTGSEAELRDLLARGFVVGITGYVCKAERGAALRSALTVLGGEMGGERVAAQLVVETDAPYMRPPDGVLRAGRKGGPAPFAKGRDSEPAMTTAVCRTVAGCLGMPHAALAAATTENARRLFFGGGGGPKAPPSGEPPTRTANAEEVC